MREYLSSLMPALREYKNSVQAEVEHLKREKKYMEAALLLRKLLNYCQQIEILLLERKRK